MSELKEYITILRIARFGQRFLHRTEKKTFLNNFFFSIINNKKEAATQKEAGGDEKLVSFFTRLKHILFYAETTMYKFHMNSAWLRHYICQLFINFDNA